MRGRTREIRKSTNPVDRHRRIFVPHEDPVPGDDTSVITIETGIVDTGTVDTSITDSGIVEPPVEECGDRLFEGELLDLVDEVVDV